MELTRKQVIEILSNIDKAYRSFTQEEIEALEYAISSLKTDEAYQIMYEGGEIFTKDNMVDMLEELKGKIAEEEKYHDAKWALGLNYSKKIIQQKINSLKEEKNDSR